MNSKIIGLSDLTLRPADIHAMLTFADDNRHYSEFHYGDWKSFVVWNQTGIDDDGVVMDRGLAARPTPRGAMFHTINEWIRASFDSSKLKLARIHSMGDGVLVPHKDFVEFDSSPWTRVHVPLLTHPNCLHSDDDAVFHMRSGEIWFLDASNLHSAINYSAGRRLNLCLDFDLRGEPVEAVFRTRGMGVGHGVTPKFVVRAPLGDSFDAELNSLAATLSSSNLFHAVGLLSKVHFFRRVPISAFFDWVPVIAERSADRALRTKVAEYIRFLRDERKMGDRFDFSAGV